MVQCPDCNKEQEANFGMVTCSSCGAVFMVEFDGTVNQPENVEYEEGAAPVEESHTEEPLFADINEEAVVAESTYDENFLEPLSEEGEAEAEPSESPARETRPSNDPLGIQKFDSSGGSNLADGEYLYDILISGIDSGEIKKDLLQALSDKRFALKMEDLRAKIRDGQLAILSLNPVRAMLIVLRIQEMDVQIEWRQRHHTQSSADRAPEVES